MSGNSPHPISNSDLQWADLVLVMEGKYRSRIQGLFRDLQLPSIESLDIPDDYRYMDDEPVDLIKSGVEYHINAWISKTHLING